MTGAAAEFELSKKKNKINGNTTRHAYSLIEMTHNKRASIDQMNQPRE